MLGMVAHARRIVVGFDGSAPALRALDVAAGLVGYGSTLAVVSVADSEENGAASRLAVARERLLRSQVPATYVRRVGEPAEELVGAAQDLEADLVVIGSRGGAREEGAELGSVSGEVVRRAHCDVLVVR
jgi:nucleotide-binding universal stress UspA family protein